jgi:hypothetical protein
VGVLLTTEEVAELVDVKPVQLRVWLAEGKFKPCTTMKSPSSLGAPAARYLFDEEDVRRLAEFVRKQSQGKRKPVQSERFVDDGTLTDFTVTQIASLWQLSPDTIQRMFQDEPDVVTLGDKNPRGKRRRVTLRIPRAVMERVKRRRSNR